MSVIAQATIDLLKCVLHIIEVLAEQRKGKKLKRCDAWNIEPNSKNLTIIRKGNYGIKEVIVDVLNNKAQVIFYPTFVNGVEVSTHK
ncbi:hypothetical protein H5410_036070 [Solanum commersonii]|uniref:Uncharacterized protein n=1 Tax=Solanum commersonii TaxID=4109 RepID=A0A9J5Y723_SOLCO|nr:hypothetical protein H5410_036070 [Solanum commersonii]